MTRPKPDSQAGRLLALLESKFGQHVYLPEILALRIAQYSARIHDLRHKYGFRIENGSDPGHPERTWFRLVQPTPTQPAPKPCIPEDTTRLFDYEEHRDIG